MIEITHINRNEALRYMGYNKNIDINNILPILDKCEKRLLAAIKPRYIYKIYDVDVYNNSVGVKGSPIEFESKDIASHLAGCSKAVFLAATLSDGADRLIREYQINDMTSALITDCMASAAVEQLCDLAEEEIKSNIGKFYMTWRFSPGYGDFSIKYQKDFITLTDAFRKTGLTLNQSNILIPRKSVTAIAGLSENPIPKKRQGCSICNMKEICQYRKRGEHCGF